MTVWGRGAKLSERSCRVEVKLFSCPRFARLRSSMPFSARALHPSAST
jgi:hypothetical protein